MADDQAALDFSGDEPTVEIKWKWSESGWYGVCPLCIKGTVPSIKTPEPECIHCKAKFKLVPGGPQKKLHKTLGPWKYQAWVTDPGNGPDDEVTKLRVTLHISSKGPNRLTADEKNAIIHRLIEKLDGVQDHAFGTVVIHLLGPHLPEEGDPTVQLWIHDWE